MFPLPEGIKRPVAGMLLTLLAPGTLLFLLLIIAVHVWRVRVAHRKRDRNEVRQSIDRNGGGSL